MWRSVLAADNHPDFRTIADFRKTHLTALRGFFEQVLRLARELGAPRVGRVALDGSKIKANASKHKAMSYGRMREKQRQLREEVKDLLAQAEAAEDEEYGPDRRGDELPADLQRRESRLKRIREAKRALEARAKAEAAAAGTPTESVKPDSNVQYNFTDPESRIMKSPDGFVQGYNVQVAVDDLQLIVGHAVTQETNDKKQLMPMITTIERQSGNTPAQLLADAGYCSDVNLAAIGDTTIDAYISTRKQKHGERPGPCPRGPLPKSATIVDRMARKLQTKTGAAVYAARSRHPPTGPGPVLRTGVGDSGRGGLRVGHPAVSSRARSASGPRRLRKVRRAARAYDDAGRATAVRRANEVEYPCEAVRLKAYRRRQRQAVRSRDDDMHRRRLAPGSLRALARTFGLSGASYVVERAEMVGRDSDMDDESEFSKQASARGTRAMTG
jgi:hypothetical protein